MYKIIYIMEFLGGKFPPIMSQPRGLSLPHTCTQYTVNSVSGEGRHKVRFSLFFVNKIFDMPSLSLNIYFWENSTQGEQVKPVCQGSAASLYM